MKYSKRDFLKKLGVISAGSGFITLGTGMAKTATAAPKDPKKPFKLTLLQTTDVHCQIHPHDEMFWENEQMVFRKTGGYAHLDTALKQLKADADDALIIDTGDMFQGSKLSVKTTGEAMVPILNALDYDLYLPGNWEVVYYKEAMQRLLGALNAPKVCANMYHEAPDGSRGELVFPPYYIWHINGVKIGFLGYTDHLVPKRQSPNYSKGIIYTPPEHNLAHYADVLKKQEGCAFVAIIAHLGLSQQLALADMPACEGIDYILGGDTHERVRVPIQRKYAKVVEPGAFGSFVGKLEITIQDGKVIEDAYELVEVDVEKYPASERVQAIIRENEAAYEQDINRVVGYSTVPLYRYFVIENTIDTMILDAISWKVPDVDIVLSNGFRFCPPRATPDETGNIPITAGYIFDMLPVDSVIRKGEVTGSQIKVWLEKELNNVFAEEASKRFGGWVIKFKGMDITFNAFGKEGERVQSIHVKGKPLELNKTYTVTACERDGDPEDVLCRLDGVKNSENKPFTLHEALISYLEEHSPVTPKLRESAKALDAPQTLLTQVSGVPYTFR
ncbi:metallophosphoesterase [Nitritalea halalkaliphila LW7]|uniref:Metallophosphoesterase n=1 Tax=Nitritalea halalkaliphila LW7 TaxID=1189621 RepID=I5CAF3_9BACT|nr:bifunctional metallophosphatase/5'-nucleotidase [Nitritalea halalkaliphila]EIM78805.1 metallophosphoesterase [Nitritalea halalkaliphila LW7]